MVSTLPYSQFEGIEGGTNDTGGCGLTPTPVHQFLSMPSSVVPSDGCITAAASRLGVNIMQLPIRLATTCDNVAAMANDDNAKFIGCCPYHLNMGFNASMSCSHPNLQLKNCGYHNCHVQVHHLCQVEWEAAKGFEETTILWCPHHHPKIPRPNVMPVFTLPCLANVDAQIAATNATINSINIQSATVASVLVSTLAPRPNVNAHYERANNYHRNFTPTSLIFEASREYNTICVGSVFFLKSNEFLWK